MSIKDWGNIRKAKILVIGHEQGLKNSETITEYCFFADYYFKKILADSSEKKKYGLAKAAFEQIQYLTNDRYCIEEIFLTNLCNEELSEAPKGKTVLIPYEKAKHGIKHILDILEKSEVEYVFPVSLQVNYLLQKFGFYDANIDFLSAAEPVEQGLKNSHPYYEPKKSSAFQLICGNVYIPRIGKHRIIPILHPSQFPFSKNLTSYQKSYDSIRDYFRCKRL